VTFAALVLLVLLPTAAPAQTAGPAVAATPGGAPAPVGSLPVAPVFAGTPIAMRHVVIVVLSKGEQEGAKGAGGSDKRRSVNPDPR